MEKRPSSKIALWVLIGILAACILLVCCVALAGLGWYSYSQSGAGSMTGQDNGTGPQVGDAAPDFTLSSISGEPVSLSDFRGRAVLVNFWTTWCEPCQEEMPLLNARYEQYSPALVILAVDQGESIADVTQASIYKNLTMPLLMDSDMAIGDLYKIMYYPTSYFIDASGVIRAIVDSSMSAEALDQNLSLIGINK